MQRQELAATLHQLNALERFVKQSATSNPVVTGKRYHFDYPRLLADLARVRAGIQDYLEPSHAQPRDPDALIGEYRGWWAWCLAIRTAYVGWAENRINTGRGQHPFRHPESSSPSYEINPPLARSEYSSRKTFKFLASRCDSLAPLLTSKWGAIGRQFR
ncbi:RAQPRD family integrative conjugative element protein [Microbulbifer sp.]|uniref:integrative conjugative element protein, RAQPRD family n=1 Tax=Microbulbifer sp. TaxID=1908541 RepID=UPI003F2E77E2